MEPITLLIGALAAARITRLITSDRITQAPRLWLLARLEPEGLAAYLVHCTWCVSVYTGLGAAAVGAWAGLWAWWWTIPVGLAYSYVAGWLASREGE